MTRQDSLMEETTQESDSVLTAVLETVAEREGVDVTDLPPLYEAVDPDALDAMFAPTSDGEFRSGRIEFAYSGYDLTLVREGGALSILTEERTSGANSGRIDGTA